jgi:hypothetical protein
MPPVYEHTSPVAMVKAARAPTTRFSKLEMGFGRKT